MKLKSLILWIGIVAIIGACSKGTTPPNKKEAPSPPPVTKNQTIKICSDIDLGAELFSLEEAKTLLGGDKWKYSNAVDKNICSRLILGHVPGGWIDIQSESVDQFNKLLSSKKIKRIPVEKIGDQAYFSYVLSKPGFGSPPSSGMAILHVKIGDNAFLLTCQKPAGSAKRGVICSESDFTNIARIVAERLSGK